jgi:hypothetical protein
METADFAIDWDSENENLDAECNAVKSYFICYAAGSISPKYYS